MPVDLLKLHEKTYGYVLRTGRRGSYKYWYKDSTTGKLYQGKKPDSFLIDQFEKTLEDPPKEDIIANPWVNYDSSNAQMIYCADSNIPFNKVGLTSREELELYESYLLSIAYKRIFENLKTFPEYYLPVNAAKIKSLHKVIFNDLYDWAGKYRNINISKEGFPFPPADIVNSEMKKLDTNLFNKINYNQKASLEELAELLSMLSSELTIIHPFREGNGRMVRLVLDIISIAFDKHPANWGVLSSPEDKQDYLQSMFDGYKKNYKPLSNFIYKLLCSANS